MHAMHIFTNPVTYGFTSFVEQCAIECMHKCIDNTMCKTSIMSSSLLATTHYRYINAVNFIVI